jgi:putative hydrolase of the HAD superfamily
MNAAKPSPAGVAHSLSAFDHVNAWVFDLDNTLYPRHTRLFEQVDRRIQDYVQRLLALGPDEAHHIQKDYYRRYGTTLRGLMDLHGIEPDAFLEYVHDIDHSGIEADPRLTAAIARLPGRKFIMTNGSRRHAEKVAEKLGFTNHFEDIFDIVRAELLPKPNRRAYEGFVAATGVAPAETAMFEDLPRNLVVPKALGMHTVLILPGGTREVFHEDWELEGRDADHIDHLTDDLRGFLEDVLTAIVASPPPPEAAPPSGTA